MNLTHLSLFSGIGGIDLAAHWAGFKTVGFVEKDLFCQKILTQNFPGVQIYDDITTFDGTRYRGVDLVSGGFPCQPFSVAGKRKGASDERHLWPEMLRVIREAQPTWVLGENVAGLLSIDGGRVFGDAISGLADLGYCVGWGVLSAYAVGACHYRKRVFIVAHAKRFRCPRDSESRPRPELQTAQIGRVLESDRDSGHSSGGGCARESWRRARQVLADGYTPMASRNWRAWEIEPVVRGAHDGLSPRLDAPRIRALGNAVCPQQVYPILKAIAETYGEKSLEVKK